MKDLRVKVATENDLHSCIKIRIESIKSADRNRLHIESNEERRTEEEWTKFFFGKKVITTIVYNNFEPVGILISRKRTIQMDWYMASVFVRNNFRGIISLVMFQEAIKEIKKRGGRVVRFSTGNTNALVIKPALRLGFKKVGKIKQLFLTKKGHYKYFLWCSVLEKKLI